jgi:hypothetical protein
VSLYSVIRILFYGIVVLEEQVRKAPGGSRSAVNRNRATFCLFRLPTHVTVLSVSDSLFQGPLPNADLRLKPALIR